MAKMSAEQARSLFEYDPETGVLRWKVSPRKKTKIGSVAGTRTKYGYVRVMYQQRSYMAHCLAWSIAYGEWPDFVLDHRDRVRDNNRLGNLRPATALLNAWNQMAPRRNTSGVKGVHFRAQRGKWQASARKQGRTYYFGLHDTLEAAAEARRAGAKELFGDFANEGDGDANSSSIGGMPSHGID